MPDDNHKSAGDELVAQLDEFRATHPSVVDSYREFLRAYSKFRELEGRMSDKRSFNLHLQHDARLPA